VAFSLDGSRIASGSWDGTVKIWNTVTGGLEHTLIGHADWVRSVAYSPDGKHIASGSIDNTIKIWGVSDEKADELLAKMSALAQSQMRESALPSCATQKPSRFRLRRSSKPRETVSAAACESSECAKDNLDFSQEELAKALRGKRLAAQSSDSAAASCATPFRSRRLSNPRETVSEAACEPLKRLEDHSPITQEELYKIFADSLQARPAVQPVLKAAAPSVEDSLKTQATQKSKYRSEDKEKNSSDDDGPLV
jgi:hypothetical protein